MNLHWNPACLNGVFVLPTQVVQQHLHLASPLQFKVLLWFAAQNGRWDTAACAKDLHKSQSAIEEAAAYWVEQQVLLMGGATIPEKSTPASESALQTDMAQKAATQEENGQHTTGQAGVVRPLPVKPQMKDVIRKQKESSVFSNLLQNVSKSFGKPISHGNMETLLYLYDTAGIPAEIIMMAVGYAVSRGKINMRYVEKVALDWLDNGITTIEAANENLLLLQQMDDAAARIQKLTGKAREPDYRQRQMAHTWIYIWGLSEELIQVAIKRAADQGKPLIPYANAILDRWREEGITDPTEAAKTFEKQAPAAKRRSQNETTSLDLPEYEQMLEDYIPTLPVRKGKE